MVLSGTEFSTALYKQIWTILPNTSSASFNKCFSDFIIMQVTSCMVATFTIRY